MTTLRDKHTFFFGSKAVSEAATKQAEYHREREAYWRQEFATSLETVKKTAKLNVIEIPVTGGINVEFGVDFGDQEAHSRMQTAHYKYEGHRKSAERYETDARVYATQKDRSYELTTEDVHYYRLNDAPRDGDE